jgi:hypothetical protein
MIHHGRSFENGVLLQGDSVRSLQEQLDDLRRSQRPGPQSSERGDPSQPIAQSQNEGQPPGPPQPGDTTFTAYQQSREAVLWLNAGMNLVYGEPSEKLTLAAATVAVQ